MAAMAFMGVLLLDGFVFYLSLISFILSSGIYDATSLREISIFEKIF